MDEVRLAFARGLKRDVHCANSRPQGEVVVLHDLVGRLIEFLVTNEPYFMRACWDNEHLCRTYRRTGEALARLCALTNGCADYARVLKEEALYWILYWHKGTMDLEENEYVDYSAIRDEMLASMARMRKWLAQNGRAKRPNPVRVDASWSREGLPLPS